MHDGLAGSVGGRPSVNAESLKGIVTNGSCEIAAHTEEWAQRNNSFPLARFEPFGSYSSASSLDSATPRSSPPATIFSTVRLACLMAATNGLATNGGAVLEKAVEHLSLQQDTSPLFQPIQVGPHQLSTRLCYCPLTRMRALIGKSRHTRSFAPIPWQAVTRALLHTLRRRDGTFLP